MLKPFLVAIALLTFALPVAAEPTPKLLVLGDSLSAAYGMPSEEGWVALLEEQLRTDGSSYEVVNASITGETTQGGRSRLPALLNTYQPAIVIIALGANDGLRGFPLHIMHDNLQTMIRQSRDIGARVLLVGMRMPPNYGSKYTAMFYDVFQRLAQEEQTALVPFLLKNVAARENMMQADGLHPTALAQDTMLDNVLPTLRPLLEPAQAASPAS